MAPRSAYLRAASTPLDWQIRCSSLCGMMYRNREEAGRLLAQEFAKQDDRSNVVVLRLPRGGVPVARIVADFLGAPIDVFIDRKLGVPWQPELGFVVILESPGTGRPRRVLDSGLVKQCELIPALSGSLA